MKSHMLPKINKSMIYSLILNSGISCEGGIPIFGFDKYHKKVFDLMEINMIPTFEQLLHAKKINTKKNKSYYQQYDVKNENLPNADNYETTNIQAHNCEVKWDRLQSRNMIWKESRQNERMKRIQ